MKLKNKLKRFFTLSRNHDGFTLVELIVVIAIMAILAGVGTVGYGGYIKAANKGADKKLVGDIMRAIETGTNSYAFVSDDSFKMGSLAFPVGFVALSTEGTKIKISATPTTEAVSDSCVFETVSNVTIVTPGTVTWTCEKTGKSGNASNKEGYIIEICDVTYCATHTTQEMLAAGLRSVSVAEEYTTGYVCTKTTSHSSSHNWRNNPVNTSVSNTTVADLSYLYQASAIATMCEYAYANQYDNFGTPGTDDASNGNPLYDSITAAFGNDLSSLKLRYENWTAEEGTGYASFYTGAPKLMDDIENLSGLLAIGSKVDGTWIPIIGTINLGIEGEYDNGEAVLSGVSNKIASTHTPETWSTTWNNDSALTWDSTSFGLSGRENFSAARMAYNSGFASYMEANGEGNYADVVRYFYTQEMNIGDGKKLGLPGLVCTDAFTDTSSPLKGKFEEAGASAEDIKRIEDLYKKYIDSGACSDNGSMLYDTMDTFASTSDVAKAYTDLNGGTIYDYYNSYVDEMTAMYNAAATASNGGIVIVVSVQNGETVFTVSPSAANPRIEK